MPTLPDSNLRVHVWAFCVILQVVLLSLVGCGDDARQAESDGCGRLSYLNSHGSCSCERDATWCSTDPNDLNCCRIRDVSGGGPHAPTDASTQPTDASTQPTDASPSPDAPGPPPLPRCNTWECVADRCLAVFDRAYACGLNFDQDDEDDCFEYDRATQWLTPAAVRECAPIASDYYSCLAQSSCHDLSSLLQGQGSGACAREDALYDNDQRCPILPDTVTVTFLEALVAPTKPDGCAWDGLCNRADSDQVAAALANLVVAWVSTQAPIVGRPAVQDAARQLLDSVVGGVFEHLAKPDPFGEVELSVQGRTPVRIAIPPVQDSFQLMFPAAARFPGVPLQSPTASFTLRLEDEDIFQHDPIGTATIRQADLLKVLDLAEDVWLPTARTVADGILMVKIRVQ